MLSHFVALYYKIKTPPPFFSQFLFANQVLMGEREALVGAGKGEVSFLSLWPAVSHRILAHSSVVQLGANVGVNTAMLHSKGQSIILQDLQQL